MAASRKAAENEETDPRLLEMLVCPLTRTNLVHDRDNNELVSQAARLAFPVRGGIPIMLASEARTLEDGEYPAK